MHRSGRNSAKKVRHRTFAGEAARKALRAVLVSGAGQTAFQYHLQRRI